MALPLGEREVHNGGMIDDSARVRTDGQSVEAQGAARTAAGVIHVYGAVASGCGFVALPDRRAAQDPMASLHGPSGAGRTLMVPEAPLRAPRREPCQPRSSTAPHLPPPVTR